MFFRRARAAELTPPLFTSYSRRLLRTNSTVREQAGQGLPCTGKAHRMASEKAKAYEPKQIGRGWAEFWGKEENFQANAHAPGPVFSTVTPPRNVTSSLHIGHLR